MIYRAEIDGLRAVAVVPVVLYHAGILFSGGFVGVDIFFVISGYLITSILIESLDKKQFSLVEFYERRARRILPALFFVVIICTPFAWAWLLPAELKSFSKSLIAVVFFATNILFNRQNGYFEPLSAELPLLHTWSLAVEEQFYLLFPLLLLAIWRFGRQWTLATIVVLSCLSLALSEWGWRHDPVANFYLAPTRTWELFAGAIAAFIVNKNGVKANNWLSSMGLAAILYSLVFFDDNIPSPSVYILIPVVGTVLLVLSANQETYAGRMLSNKVLVGFGLLSYSAYLWHQPIFAFTFIRLGAEANSVTMLFLSGVTFILAYLSWRFVETPFRQKARFSGRQIFTLSAIVASGIICVGLIGYLFNERIEKTWLSLQPEITQQTYELINAKSPTDMDFGADDTGVQDFASCRFNVPRLSGELEERLASCNQKFGSGILVLGDSHAIDLYGVLASRFKNNFLVGVTQGGCRPHSDKKQCQYRGVKAFLEKNPEVFKLVIFEQAGYYLLKTSDGKKGSRRMFERLHLHNKAEGIIPDLDHINGTLSYLKDISDSVQIKWFLPRLEPHISDRQVLRHGCEFDYYFRDMQRETFETVDRIIEGKVRMLENENLTTVSQNKMMAFTFPADFMTCNHRYWSDGDHFSADGEVYFGKRIPDWLLTSNR